MADPMTETTAVRIVCERCKGTGKDPAMGSAGTHRAHVPDPCAIYLGGCGGSGLRPAQMPRSAVDALVGQMVASLSDEATERLMARLIAPAYPAQRRMLIRAALGCSALPMKEDENGS